ncbi:putative acetyltransferase [Spinactinospora alkalitolerans]|uniref:Putative acetyltransferase n=1 Tax=Spinactinospora alkalitolerans TaxID=687207 RepID=A0A852TRZ2_9ACTN|nr:GNAT family N-acetyltransferase [Spinactinospora alkalitolerans]NYE46315.1 putative acetyltransferase [Spinactinospora alkalitolerans]
MSFSHDTAASGGALPWRIRPIEEPEFPTFVAVFEEAFASAGDPSRHAERARPIAEFDRTLAAFDGDRVVGTTGIRSFTMTLPGGQRPVAGVTAVSVLPTHRRRGILSALMRRQLSDIRERGREAVAALFASEAPIYGRYGYGPAARSVDLTLRRGEGALRADAPRDPALRVRLAAPKEVRKELALVHQGSAAQRVGEFVRDDNWWKVLLEDPEDERGGFSEAKCALVEDDAGPLGYALYRIRPAWDAHGLADSALHVGQLHATAPAAYALLWEHLLSRDLVTTVTAGNRPVDDPLLHLLTERDRARSILTDNLWVRLVDLPRALEQRAYSAPVDLVIEVTDRVCPWNAGRWQLSADTRNARCEPAEREPDVRLDVATLGAAYLGGTRLGSYAAAGLVTEEREGAVAELDTALSHPTQPHCGVIF